MIRLITSSLLAFILALSLIGGTAFAANGSQYRAEPAKPPTAARLIAKGLVWKCGVAGCIAPQANSRPIIDCSALAQEVGTLLAFTVGGAPLDPAALEKCNAHAR